MNNPFLTAEWRKLVMANYVVDASLLKEYIPAKTELDIYQGKCFLSLVGFMFLNTKVKGCKIPFHINFEEVNLRFYVKHLDGKEWKRGVVFIKEIVPKRMITFVANKVYGEKYETRKMSHKWNHDHKQITVKYEWNKENNHSIFVNASDELQWIDKESEEEFITEHFWGYTKISDTKTAEYEVKHPRWKVYPVIHSQIKVDFSEVYGIDFKVLNSIRPHSVFLAEGSEISVMKGKNL